ncbi:MAG: HAMP domain-containing histidine kinase [Defluviitaleaceae bacterium]|nr:HAMP domain-containing histidine kinase [Defluviitaleaceae bacterium]MCL2837398.1 HAMP domain-containing histidine kinase [Defluviitaleaceae bacterium]
MKNIKTRVYQKFLNPELDFRVKLFNVLAVAGMLAGVIMGTINAVNGGGIFNVVAGIGVAALAFALLLYSTISGRYKFSYLMTIAVVFFFYFPTLFFRMGGYHGGKISFFIFAVMYTAFMLEGKLVRVVITLELLFFTCVCIYAYLYPKSVTFFLDERGYLISNVSDMLFVSVALSVILVIYFRMYNQQQRKLDKQNAVLAKINRAKTEFFANTSHEMRTPLTVVSVNVQTALRLMKRINDDIKDPDMEKLLVNAQKEIMRLSRVVGGMLTLASISEDMEKRKIDMAVILFSTADTLLLLLSQRGNELHVETGKDLFVFGDADLLTQVVANLIQNAHAHTENDVIQIHAARDGGKINVTIGDNGSGIPPEILPRLFERGVTGGRGTGYGLFLCKTVVESHGGEILIESKQGKGTVVRFALPVSEGQLEGDAV